MRYRIETYDVSINGTSVVLTLPVPNVPWAKIEDWDDIDQDEKITQYITESLRLIVDETAGVVFCSSMQKANIVQAGITQQSGVTKHISIEFTIPTGKTIASTDQFTIEMDWGDEPSGLTGGDAAEQVKDFFGIVKDGDTVKVVTGDGGEEIVEPVGLMDEDDVYDYLEDIAVLMGGITAQQAASITAATRAIIHGGSGSGEGGEGGSGSGSGE